MTRYSERGSLSWRLFRKGRALSGRVKTFWTVTVGQARLAIFGGALLVGLVVLYSK